MGGSIGRDTCTHAATISSSRWPSQVLFLYHMGVWQGASSQYHFFGMYST